MAHSQKLMASSVSRKTKSGAALSRRMKTASAKKMGMSDLKSYSLGIDPGYAETGLVLRLGSQILEYALTSDRLGSEIAMVFRSQAIAQTVMHHVVMWVHSYQIQFLEIGLEMPVYNRNVVTYAKQRSLIQAIEAGLCRHVAPFVEECWLSEPTPSESKHLATGNGAADKAEVLRASPFPSFFRASTKDEGSRDLSDVWIYYNQTSMETLGDAWSHSLAVANAVQPRFDLKQMGEIWN